MMKQNKKQSKIISLSLFVILIVLIFAPVINIMADNKTINISTVKDYISFAKKCKTDTWSQDKTVNLLSNIDFSDSKFVTIPTFGGHFNGNGYTLSGINIESKGSYIGIFRYIQKNATVENLNVSGHISPDGTKKYVGGIVGENSGTIKNCFFNGNISGESNTGGICGYQKESGKITSCTFEGEVIGNSYTGGICGQSYGIIESCKNNGKINTTNTEKEKSIQDIKIDNVDISELRTTENVDAPTDTGGICGYSKGKILNCINMGNVGYKSVGYNTGGICGRQSGYVSQCKNYGTINGRKDIGGISGQAEPYILLEYSQDIFERINSVLSKMNKIVRNSDFLSGSDVDNKMDDIDENITNIRNSTETLSKDTKKYSDDITDNVNDFSNKLHNYVDDLRDVSEELSEGIETLSDASSYLNNSGLSLKKAIQKANAAINDAQRAKDEISDCMVIIKSGIDVDSMKSISDSLKKCKEYISNIKSNISSAKEDINDAVGGIESSLSSASRSVDNANKSVSTLVLALDTFSSAFDKIYDITDSVSKESSFNLPAASDYFGNDFDEFIDNIKSTQKSFTALRNIVKEKKNTLSDDIDNLSGEIEVLSEILKDAYNDNLNPDEKDIIEDVSEIDSPGDTRGKIDSSENTGKIYGDINVGGITGAMAIEYDFDPEDDIQKENNKSLKFSYRTKCVIRRCKNNGEINSSKDYCGGIAGKMDLGSIISCENYGDISADDGNYAGGISGLSETVIRNSVSKCNISGTNYVGGIVGKGKTVSDCYSCVKIFGFEECAGSVAGYGEKINFKGNFFVSDDIGGIDDINYSAIAEETDIETFVNHVKSQFGTDVTFCLTFKADDKEIAKVPFSYKVPISEKDIPKVPKKSGYQGKWSYYDYKNPTCDAVIEAEYYRDIEIIESDLKRKQSKSVIMVCGAFDSYATVYASKLSKYPQYITDKRPFDGYSVKINGVYTEKYTVRYLPVSDSPVDIYIENEGKIERVNTKTVGSYLEFETAWNNFKVYEVPKSFILIITVCVLILLILLFAVIFKTKKIPANSND